MSKALLCKPLGGKSRLQQQQVEHVQPLHLIMYELVGFNEMVLTDEHDISQGLAADCTISNFCLYRFFSVVVSVWGVL